MRLFAKWIGAGVSFAVDLVGQLTPANTPVLNQGDNFSYDVSCTDIFGNTSGDWIGTLAPSLALNGNQNADPHFCDYSSENYTINSNSPCAPWGNSCNSQIGALAVNCGSRPPKTVYVPAEYPTIQQAVDSSVAGDTILVADGIYREHVTLAARTLRIRSITGHQSCQLVSDTSLALSILRASVVTLEGLSITGQQNNSSSHEVFGGGIYADSSDVTLVGCWVLGCNVYASCCQAAGGGLYASNSRVSLVKTVIRRNSAGALGSATGGGIYCVGRLKIDSCIIDSNFSGYPGSLPSYHGGGSHSTGGIYAVGDSITICHSSISFNSCGGSSLDKAEVGGILLAGNYATVEYDSILFNSSSGAAIDPTSEWGYSSWGGGLKITGDSNLIRHNIIRGNSVSMGNHYRWPSTLRDLRGGGAFVSGAGNEFSDNVVSKNVVSSTWDFPSYSSASVVSYGGGLYASGENHIFGNTFFGNVAGFQGLIWAGKARPTVSTSELVKAYGGGCFIDGASMMGQNLFEANSTAGLCTGASDSLGCSTANLGAAAYVRPHRLHATHIFRTLVETSGTAQLLNRIETSIRYSAIQLLKTSASRTARLVSPPTTVAACKLERLGKGA